MSRHRRAARIDENQPRIVEQLRQIPGVTVATGMDDILCGAHGRTYWYELKTSAKAEVRPSQIRLRETWTGHYKVVTSVDEIMRDMGLVRDRAGKEEAYKSRQCPVCKPWTCPVCNRRIGSVSQAYTHSHFCHGGPESIKESTERERTDER